MPAICFYFQVHQPWRVKKYRAFDVGHDHDYFNDNSESSLNNKYILERVINKCYLPTNALIYELLQRYPEFKVSYSLSGVFLEQLEKWFPDALKSFQDLVKLGMEGQPEGSMGRVEILEETYYHSLAYLYSKDEFKKQVTKHRQLVKRLFGVEPKVFRNTELIYNNEIGNYVESMGYEGILAEGADHVMEWRSPNFVYQPKGAKKIKLLLKNYKLSDDIAFRFSSRDWTEFPLTADKFGQWVSALNGSGEIINLFMDYETFGEHQWADTGIFDFLRALPGEVLKHPDNCFLTPSEAVRKLDVKSELDVHNYISWADMERDLSAWRSNPIQHDALRSVYGMEKQVLETEDEQLVEDWRRLQTSDHFYYMCTKFFNDGDVHKYFNPYNSPYEAFIAYMNAIHDLRLRLDNSPKRTVSQTVADNRGLLGRWFGLKN